MSGRNDLWSGLKNLSPYSLVLICQLFVLIPHASHLPSWLTLYGFLVIFSQLPIIKKRFFWHKKRYQKRVWRTIQLVGFTAGLAGIYATYRTAFGLDVGVSFLLLCLISKLLELFSRRDAYVALNLALFVLAGAFLMDQGLSTSALVFLGVLATLYAMIAHNDAASIQKNPYPKHTNTPIESTPKQAVNSSAAPYNAGRMRSLSLIAFLALPLMAVLFVFFPRLPPLWSINLSGAGAKTGMSDSMAPGDIASLSQSSELAFRVLFTGNAPPKGELYFRGLVFSDFDGTTWRVSQLKERYLEGGFAETTSWLTSSVVSIPEQTPVDYQVIMQPTNQNWLFALDFPYSNTKGVFLTREYVLESRRTIASQFTYEASHFKQAKKDVTLEKEVAQDTLGLPAKGNPQTRTFAKTLFNQVGQDPARYSTAILNWISTQNFGYTLEPPPLFDNRIDEFLFTTRQGFCEHYASAYTFLMRAAGVPARVVVGYQGGEQGRDGQSWEVRQMDAHAWSEIWLKGRGWVRVDPTAAVLPERVNQGMNALAQTQGAALFGEGAAATIRYQQYKMLHKMRKWMDHAGFIWQRDVVGFDQDKQKKSLLEWFNLTSLYQQVMVMFGLISVIIGVFVGTVLWRRRKIWHPLDAPFMKLSKSLAKHGLERKPTEGIIGWLERISSEVGHTDTTSQTARQAQAVTVTKDIASAIHVYRRARFSADADLINQKDATEKLMQASQHIQRKLDSIANQT